MFNLFKKTKQAAASVKNSFKSTQVIIEEIHDAFDSASDKLLKEAKEILSGSYDTEKAERLKKIGFVSAKKVVEAENIIKNKRESERLATTINYFKVNYPNNKFITEDMVKKICQKYGLLCAETQYYISDVPEKNLSEIEAFSLRQEDMVKHQNRWYRHNSANGYWFYSPCLPEDNGACYGYTINNRMRRFSGEELIERPKDEKFYYSKPELQICASVKDFDTKNMRIEDGYRLSQNLPDPIVLQPVKGGYLIVSKWGLPEDDELLINETNN